MDALRHGAATAKNKQREWSPTIRVSDAFIQQCCLIATFSSPNFFFQAFKAMRFTRRRRITMNKPGKARPIVK